MKTHLTIARSRQLLALSLSELMFIAATASRVSMTSFAMNRKLTIALGNNCGGRAVRYDRNLETVLEKLPQVCFGAEVCRHAGQDDLINAALSQL